MIIAIIPAKGESKRFPNKNLRELEGVSLLERAINYSRDSGIVDKIYVSTDNETITSAARQLGVEVILRGPELGGETPLFDVYYHAAKQINQPIEYLVGIQPDHPTRTADLKGIIAEMRTKQIDELVTVDRHGRRNGSLRIFSAKALLHSDQLYMGTVMDDCVNIDTELEFNRARKKLSPHSIAIEVEGRMIGDDQPAFIIAEAACNHMCDLDLAFRMIDEAAATGADAIKFQTYSAEKLVTDQAVAFWGEDKIRQIDYYRKLDRFGKKEYAKLFSHAREKGIVAFSSPFDEKNSAMLIELGMPLIKNRTSYVSTGIT
jgi:spore coat polysaccharide biosynthesis protein SpsF (cytidylyltransferase family)